MPLRLWRYQNSEKLTHRWHVIGGMHNIIVVKPTYFGYLYIYLKKRYCFFSPKIIHYSFVVGLSTAANHVNIYTSRRGADQDRSRSGLMRFIWSMGSFKRMDQVRFLQVTHKTQTSRWWNFKYVLFLARSPERWSNFTKTCVFFRLGWFNHEPSGLTGLQQAGEWFIFILVGRPLLRAEFFGPKDWSFTNNAGFGDARNGRKVMRVIVIHLLSAP